MAIYSGVTHEKLCFYSYVSLPEGIDDYVLNGITTIIFGWFVEWIDHHYIITII